jgi:hypothetical protein
MLEIKPFRIDISDEAIADLKTRLGQVRWPQPVTDDWTRGQPVALIKELAEQWRDTYDWRAHEAELNRYPHFMTGIEGQPIRLPADPEPWLAGQLCGTSQPCRPLDRPEGAWAG